MSTDLINLIDNRVKKLFLGMNTLKSKPAKVISIHGDMVTVKFPDSETPVTIPNYSGNFIRENSDILVYYWGNLITKNTAYIGKSATSVTACNSTEYDAKENILYFLKDTGEIYIGSIKYGGTNLEKTTFLDCDTQLTGTVLECDFVASGASQKICFSGDLVLYSEALQNAEIQYFLDNTRLDFTPKISVNGYTTQHLSIFFDAESGEHNFKVVIDSDIVEQVQGKIIGQNLKLIESKVTTADDYVYLIENDKVKLIYYKGTETRIRIPSEIGGKPVTAIESTCFTEKNLKYAVIPDTVTEIF